MSEKEKLMFVKNTVYAVILISKSILLINHTNTFVMPQKDRRHGMNMINVLNSTIVPQIQTRKDNTNSNSILTLIILTREWMLVFRYDVC